MRSPLPTSSVSLRIIQRKRQDNADQDEDRDDERRDGYFSASRPRPMTNTSSKKLSAQFENGSGLALAATRVLALVKWLPAAIVPPSRP